MPPAESPLKADPAERSLPPGGARSRSEPYGWVVVLCVSLVYAALLTLVWFERRPQPEAAPEAIPIEIVAEPPPPAPPPQPPAPAPAAEPQQAAPPPDEPPATDAPRAGTEPEKQAEAPAEPAKPAAEPPPRPPSPAPEPGQAGGPRQEGSPQGSDAAAEPAEDRPGEVTRPAGATNEARPDEPQKRAEAEATPANPDGYPATPLAPMPDADFAAYAEQTPFAGNASRTYLTTLYGMIVPRLRDSGAGRGKSSKLEGMIAFSVDGRGNLVDRRLVRPSGSRELDAAAMAAIAAAAPFPPPPPYGGPLGLTFTYGPE
ncbi:MAG: TonB family protein [Roseiarcus sp.]